jgi:ubiquinone/menaquinone biosynthesis C-methylase UbiE
MKAPEKHFNEWAKDYNKYIFVSAHHDKWVQDKLIKELNLKGKPAILDLGTGNGRLLLAIAERNPKCNFIGLDFSEGMLNQARANFRKLGLKGKFIKSSMIKIPLKDESLDYVISSAAIHHVEDKEKLFSEIYRILKKGGKLAVIDQFDRTDKKYRALQAGLKRKNPAFWKKYVISFEKAERQTAREFSKMKTEHPKEYHLAPFTIKKLLERMEFQKVKIIPTPRFFGIYIAKKY